jgi:tetratricopeptide (TPR) repeat protein
MRLIKGSCFQLAVCCFLAVPITLCAQPKKKATALYDEGVELDKVDKDQEALEKLNEALELDAEYGNAYLKRGRLRTSLSEGSCSQEAIDDYSNALKFGADKIEAYCGRASAYVCTGSHEKAKADIDELFTLVDPKLHAESMHVRGYYYFEKGELAKAANDFNRSIRADAAKKFYPKNVFYRSAVYLKMHKYEAAHMGFSELIDNDPKNDELYFQRSLTEDRMGNKKDAMVDINMAISLNHTHETYYIERGKLRISTGAYNEANADFQKAIELIEANHGKVDHIEHMDLLLFEGLNGYFAGNEEWLETGASKLKQYVPSYSDQEKIETFESTHEEKVQVSDCLFLLANSNKDYTTSINMLNAAAKHCNKESVVNKVKIYRCKAQHYVKAGKKDKACDAYNTAMALGDKGAKKELKNLKCK